MKLGLGTVQFGLDYGISNRDGVTPPWEIANILAMAADNGIEYLDTAPVYGESEARLGEALFHAGHQFRIITKTRKVGHTTVGKAEADALRTTFLESLEKLRVDRVYALLVHHADDLMSPGGELLLNAMQDLAREGLVEKIGVSVYDSRQIDALLEIFTPQIVQCPLNVFDQRLIASGHLGRLRQLGTEIHLRSLFLQGLLLMDPRDIPPYFTPCRDRVEEYSRFLATKGWTRLQGALLFGLSRKDADALVIGVTSVRELSEILDLTSSFATDAEDFGRFAIDQPRFVDPSQWRLPA